MRNPSLKRNPVPLPDDDSWVELIRSSDITALSRLITLTESNLKKDRIRAEGLIQKLLPFTGNSIRIGITGVPGVGKSTFIEAFGKMLTSMHHKVAVLAVDPSSPLSGGSILGDKTRMEKLASDPNAYIRPSAAGKYLGGVAGKTRESILLCEAAGFDVIIIETVGVGQSETMVHGMTDAFLLLMLPGAGDELQGMKKGIVEMADLIVINKADGDNLMRARIAKKDYEHALHMLPSGRHHWTPEVLMASALESTGIEEVWLTLQRFKSQTTEQGEFQHRRIEQVTQWFHQTLETFVRDHIFEHAQYQEAETRLLSEVQAGRLNPVTAARELFSSLISQ
jgi:LAO/AO transport system kinase